MTNFQMGAARFESLDGMRGLCALIVATFHCDMVLNSGHLLNHGWLSVDIFFVISGFIIAHVYERRLLNGSPLSDFLRARARRLLPTQLLGTAIVAATYLVLFASGRLHDTAISWTILAVATVYGLLLLPMQFSPFGRMFTTWNPSYPINPPLWSLQGEWVINLIYAKWLFAFSAKILTALFALLAIYLFYAAARPIGYGPLPPSFLPDIARASAGFIAGLLIYRAHSAGVLAGVPRLAPGIVYSAWFLICAMPTRHPMPTLEMAISLAVAPALVMLLVRGERPAPRPLVVLGTLSYPLYASHFAIINLASVWLGISQTRHSPFLAVPMLAAALLLAFCIDRSLQFSFRKRAQYSAGR